MAEDAVEKLTDKEKRYDAEDAVLVIEGTEYDVLALWGHIEALEQALADCQQENERLREKQDNAGLALLGAVAEIKRVLSGLYELGWDLRELDTDVEEQESQGTFPTAETAVRLYQLATKDGNEGIERAEFVMDDGGRVIVLAALEEEAQDEQ